MSLTTFWEYPISQPSKSSNAIWLLSKLLGDAPSPHRIPTVPSKGLEIYWVSCHPHANKPSDGFFSGNIGWKNRRQPREVSFNGFLSFVNWIISGTRLGECFFFNWFLNAFSFLMPQLHCFCWAKGVVHVRRKKKNQEQNCCVGLMCPWGNFFEYQSEPNCCIKLSSYGFLVALLTIISD